MAAGRPRMYKDKEELEEAIDAYFNDLPTKQKVITNKVSVEVPVPTITGLAYHLGFESRQSFYDYGNDERFSYTIKRARLFIEKEYEEQLIVGNTVGAIFALKNFGWRDKQEIETKNDTTINWHEEKTYDTPEDE